MAKLLTEFIDISDIDIIKEETEVDGEKKKQYYLKGPFLEAEVLNKNNRKYMKKTLIREVDTYYNEKIKKRRSLGELDHPPDPTINLDRVSHLITELKMEGNIGYGCAKVIDTPKGRIAKTLIDENILLGMSTRGIGELDGNCVADSYRMICIDIVCDPSAPSAFVEGILENKEFIIGKDGEIVEKAVENLQKKVNEKYNKYTRKDMSSNALQYLTEFINEIKIKNM